MKKNLLKLLALAAIFSMPLSCNKPSDEPDGPDVPDEPTIVVPEKQVLNQAIAPAGDTYTVNVVATADWTVEADENYKWISVAPTSGAKTDGTDIVFTATSNDSGRERSAMFYVMQGKDTIFEIFISQPKLAIPLGEGDYEFLKAIVDNKMLGPDTPTVDDWYTVDPGALFGDYGFTFTNEDGVWYIETICQDGTPKATFVDMPAKMDLQYLVRIRFNGVATLAGKFLPQDWNTPKLSHIALSHTKMSGFIPKGFAASPMLSEIYFDDTDFYGALPHEWASKVIEVALIGSVSNTSFTGDDPYAGDDQCPYLGYMVPASLDVILNSQRTAQSDKTQMKLGGVKEGHWLGFEKGWGQVRYELFDPAAVAGDGSVWSDWRLLIGKEEADPDFWQYYFSNMGYDASYGYRTFIPKQMMDWDQSVADAFSAEAKACHDAGIPIDMTKFGKEVEETPDDDIAPGNVITPDVTWTE